METLPASPDAVLWDQPISAVNLIVYANQSFETVHDSEDIFIGRLYQSPSPGPLSTILLPR